MRGNWNRTSTAIWLSPEELKVIARYAKIHKVSKHKAMRMMMVDGAVGSGVSRKMIDDVRDVLRLP